MKSPTGRLPPGPNVQNIPIRTPEAAAIKAAFIYEILQGTDRGGDPYWIVYDTYHRIGVGPLFRTRLAAENYARALT